MLPDIRKEMRSYAYDLVSQGKVSYCHLDEQEKSMLTSFVMKNTDNFRLYEYITEADKKDELPLFLINLLSKGSSCEKDDIINALINNACKYASQQIDLLLEDMESQYNCDKKYFNEEI